MSTLLTNSPHTMILYELFLSYTGTGDNTNANNTTTHTTAATNAHTITSSFSNKSSDNNSVPLIIYLSQIGRNPLFRLVYAVYSVYVLYVTYTVYEFRLVYALRISKAI